MLLGSNTFPGYALTTIERQNLKNVQNPRLLAQEQSDLQVQ